ncbi:uncharacterized protein LOC123292259 [Chrysoperla carnea]|uniref:uncharacterized protein LOC123292259 n=1 Tax=Chrysoperla carnea TaxID=189513 RepID=UPI001D087A08|nr:uncharacterized protein LOC123292259 [Chrysoperla carnea]
MFSMRIFSVDHYMSSPILGLDPTYSHFRGKEVKQVPVLRIFGANKTGHKTCLHVHGVFPYLHIPHDETSLESTEKLCYRVATSLDKAINILMGQSDSTTQHVFDVTPVAGVPLYGYHNRKHQFLKIRFFNPFSIKKAATLFQNGTILDRIYQPHDAHINYELQFMIDFNLHGMNNIYLSDIKYRIDEKIDSSIIDDIPSQQILNKNITRISTCKYEIDCLCESILNFQEVTNGKLSTNPGIAAIWEEERHRRQLQNKNTQDIAPTASQFRTKLTETNSEIFFKNRLRDRLETIKNSNVSSVPSLNQSIYPSEVSDPNQFLNASIAHLMQNPELSFTPIEKSDSIVNESLILSLTQEAKKPNKPIIDDIYNALIDLIDEDSILSQHPLNEHAVALEDEIEQESHDLEQTLVEENEMFSLNQKENESTEIESEVINEIFSSNDSFMKHVNVSQLEQNIEVHLEHTDLDNFSEDTVIESEKQYSIFYDDILEMKKTQLKSTELTFSQLSNDTLDSVIENEIEKIEKSHNEESIIYSSDSDELIFDGEWKRIPQIDGATKDLKEKPKRKSRLSKSNQPEIFREILCEYTGMIYKIEPVIEPKLPKKKLGRQKSKNTKEQKKPIVKVLKVEKNNLNVEDLTKSINYMPVPLQDVKMPVTLEDVKPNNTVLLSMPIIDEQYDELLKDFDHFLSQSTFTNSNFASQNEIYKIYPPNELNTTYSKPESSDDSIIMPPVDVIIKQDLDSTFTIKNECIDSKQSINFESYIEPKSFNIKTTQVIKSEPLIKNETILQRPNDETYLNQEPSHIFMDDFLNCTFVINDHNLPSIKGLISEMINAIAPNETFEIYPESSCNLYHEMNAIISGKTTMVDISCRFLQNVRECHYRKILNSEQTSDVPYILRLNRNLEPIAIDTCDENQFPTTTKYTIDKNKFIKSIIYDNSLEITDKHTIYCKNGKIVIEENLFNDNQKSRYEHYTNWEKVKFNIKEGRPWNSTKDSLKKQVKKVHSSPKIVTSKPFDSKLRDFITNNNTFNVQNKTNENIPLIKKSIKLGEKNIDEFKDEITNENQCKDFKKQDKSTKKESKLNNLKNNSESKSKEINLELKNNLNIDDKIENQCVSENRITQKIDSVIKNTNDILKKFESENKISEKKLKLKHLQNNDEISEKEIESKAAYEDRTSNEIICKIPLNLIPQKVFENLKNDKLLIDTINLASSSSTLIQERLLNKENQVLLKNNIKSAKSKWSKSSKKLNQSKKLKQNEEGFVKNYPIAQSSPNKQQYKNENNVTKLVTNENNTGTRKDRTKKKNVLSNDYQMNLQKNTETFAQDKIENHVKEFNLKEILSENVTHSSPDMIETVKYLEKIETPLENNKTEQNHAILQLITKKKDSKKSSETVTLSSVEEELATELNVRSENNIDNASNHVSDYLNLTSFENKQATRNKFSKGKRKTIQFSKTKKSVEMNSSQNISENGETLLSTSNSVQFMKKREMPLKKQIQKKRIIRKSTIERLIEDNDCSNISENEPRRLRSMQKSSNVRVFFKNLEINKNLENHKTSNDDNKMIKIEEFTTVLNENSTENNDSLLIDTKSDHSNLSAEQVSKSYDIELSPTIKSSTSKCKTLKTEKKINSDGLNSHKKMVQFNSRPDLTENGENCCMISMANIDNPNPIESMEKIEINVQFPKEEHNTIVKSKCTKQLKDLKVFVENLEIHENSAKNQLNNVNLNLKSPVDIFSNTSDHQNGLMKDAFEQEPSTSKYLQSKLRNNLENISLNNINLDTKSSIDIVLNTSDSRKGLTGEISKSFEKEQLKNVQKKRKKRNPYTRRRKMKKTVKINCHDSITDGLNLGKSIRTSSESKKFEKLEELKRNAKTCDIEPQDKMTNESEMNTLEDRIVQRPVRQAKLNACKNIQNFSILFGVHSRRIDFKQNRETNLNNIPTSTVNHIEENLDQLQNQKENLPLKTYLPKSSQENMEVLEQNLSNYENIPGIDGTLDVLLTTSSDDSSTDSSGDDHVDILFVDGLNNEQSIREKYSLRECSVVLSRFDATKNEQVKQEKQEISIKRKLRSQSRVMTPNKILGTSQQSSFVPLDIAFTKSPTSRNLKDNEKQRRAKKRLKFDNQQSYSNETTADPYIGPSSTSTDVSDQFEFRYQKILYQKLQNIEDNFKDKNFQSASEIEEILPQSVGGELIQQHFESQSYNNQNDMNNVIQNSCDNSSDLVNNSISDKNRRRSLRNRTLLSETKKIAKHSTNISKPSTSIGKIVPETSINSNRTYVEENTGCVFSPKSTKKLSLINLSQVPLQDEADAAMGQFKNCSPEIESDDSITIPNPTEINRENISPSPEHEIQLLISPRKTQKNYSNAFEYDLKNKYFPQPGCSTTKGDNLASESHPGEKITNLCENETSQSLLFENNEKLPQTQVSECDVESFYDITFGDCTKLDEDDLVSNSKSNSSFHCAQNINEFDQKPSQSTEMQLSGLSFQSDQILTQTPNEKLNILNLSTIEFGKGVKRLTNGYVILMPKFNPPSYDDIKNSAAEYNIPEVQYENPFYSVPTDATGRIEIGHKILKIPTKIVQDLSEFTSNLEFDALNVWRQRKIDNMHVNGGQNFASNREILITPNIKPPSLKDIEVWLKAKNYLKDVKPKRDESVKIKIRIPSSPGGGGNDSDDSDSLTLTPCTPRNESIQTPIDISINTPKSAQNSTILTLDNFSNTPKTTQIGQSPSMIHKGTKHILKNKRVKVALAKSFNKSQENENLLDPSVANLLNDPQFRKDLNSPLSNSSCLITGVTLDNTHGFKVPLENFQDVKAMIKYQYLTTVILELHIKNREDFKPNPRLDPIVAIFYSIYNDVPENFELPQSETGVICVGSNDFLMGTCTSNIKITYVESELQLFDKLIELFTKWDPDILAGYEIGRLSWGYLLERSFHLQLNLPKRLSRIPESRANTRIDENGQMSDLNFTGRLFLEIWRLMRHEINLYSYSFENIYFHILHERIPKHSFRNLSTWFESTRNRYITVQYYLKRVTGVLSILDQLDFIGRTSELARLFGIQFYEVLSRGSQFRVESMMLRLTKPLNYIPVTPSVTQRAKMKAPEFLPLIMEPDSRLYNDPIIVLDFQSLYPSMIIAYNYCFSTCLGRVSELGQSHPFEFGATQLRVNPKLVEAYLNNNKLNISPCGVAFVNDSVRQGILPRMLKEILDCRLMVKKSLKENKDDATLKRVLNSRQLGLKLIANVTYGYTAANFSGRMPCCELGDSVVSKGRETLERAIQMVEKNEKWRAKVVYGDTDSLFVITPGRSRKDAFEIGKEIADAVTNDNPTPVKLKLEKIYQPCILQTKKRYVGYMYESPDQEEPVYNAKGIETVRRDGCPAVAKILEKTLRILFETKDMSMVKQYVCRQFSKIITGRINLQDLIFAREFRGLNGYRPGAMVPALEIAKRYKQQDPRSEPLRSERVPYVIASGAPGTTLVRLAKGPHELLSDPALKPHIQYYITKVIIPPLNRCLSLCGVDVHAWYKDLPRKYKLYFPTAETSSKDAKKTTIAQHFATASCASCETQTRDGICSNCINDPQKTVTILEDKLRKWERNLDNIRKICSSCCGRFEETQCTSLDCPVLYRLTQAERDCEQATFVRELVNLKF